MTLKVSGVAWPNILDVGRLHHRGPVAFFKKKRRCFAVEALFSWGLLFKREAVG